MNEIEYDYWTLYTSPLQKLDRQKSDSRAAPFENLIYLFDYHNIKKHQSISPAQEARKRFPGSPTRGTHVSLSIRSLFPAGHVSLSIRFCRQARTISLRFRITSTLHLVTSSPRTARDDTLWKMIPNPMTLRNTTLHASPSYRSAIILEQKKVSTWKTKQLCVCYIGNRRWEN